MPFMENIKGTDGKTYVNIYYIAVINTDISELVITPQEDEINEIKWVELNNIDDLFDNFKQQKPKKKLLHQIQRSI